MIGLFDLDNWREIGATLSRNKTRTFLTGFGIFWGTFMLALLMGGAAGLRGMLMREVSGLSQNLVFMFPQKTTKAYKGFAKGASVNMNDQDVALLRSHIPEIEYSSILIYQRANTTYKDRSQSININGIEADYLNIYEPILYSGRLLNETDIRYRKKVVLIGCDAASELFGDEDPLGKYVNAGGAYLQVVGVVGQKSENVNINGRMDESMMTPITKLRQLYNMGDRVYFFAFTLESGVRLDHVKDKIMRVMRVHHPIHPDDNYAISYMDVSEIFRKFESLFLVISLLAMFVGGGTLMAGIIGVGNIMWIIVKERTQEIGIRRAIGARPIDIIVQVLSEGLVLTSVAGVAGITLATAVLAVADTLTANPLTGSAGFGMTFHGAVWIMATFMILGTLAGFIPAIRTMKIKPVEAINTK